MVGDGPGWTSVSGTGERPISVPRQDPRSLPQARRLTPLHVDFACTPPATVIEITHFNLMVLAKMSVGLRLVTISAHSAFGIISLSTMHHATTLWGKTLGGGRHRGKAVLRGEIEGRTIYRPAIVTLLNPLLDIPEPEHCRRILRCTGERRRTNR